ncbi:hypothetical protein L6452_36447 [Arctium lappa]|uniref:Uncharacterized protein n=1 Tax=Arctium lappa TaxID=4217 RepID=A0ACB8Y961_ARCLA|nr:hypothetical protein L6452_36447 [Arctium lappa]
MIQDENVILDDLSDQASHETPMPSVPSVGANLSASRRTPNDVFPIMMYILPYKPNNYFVDFDRIKMHPVIRAILRGHPLARALTSCAERLRLILELPEPNFRPGRTSYDQYPSEVDVLEGIRNLGYVGALNKVSDFDKSNLPPVWYALFSVLIRCLTAKHSGTDNASLLYLRLFYAVIYDLHVDYTYIYSGLNSWRGSNPAIPRRLSWPQVPDTEMIYIQKQKQSFNYSMTIPYALIANYADMTDDSVVEYCMENDFVEAGQDEPSHDAQAASFHEVETAADQEVDIVAEQEVGTAVEQEVEVSEEQEIEEDVADKQINDVLVDIVIEPVVHDVSDTTDVIADEDEDRDVDDDIHDDIPGSEDDDNDDHDGNDGDQPSLRVYTRQSKEPEVDVSREVVSEDESVSVNPSVARIQVDELNLAFAQASAQIQSQAPTTSLAAIHSTTVSAVELSSVQARVSSDKFTTLNEMIRQLSDKMDAEKEAQIQKMKTFFKGKMPEIDASMIPQEIPFRRPSGVIISESSSAHVSTTAPPIVSLPIPPLFTQSAGISSSVPTDTSSRSSLHDHPISELTDMLYARLLSMSPPQHQDQDLISLLRNFQPTPPPVHTSDSERITDLSEEFQSFRSEVQSSFADIKSFMTQAFSELSNRFDLHTQSCRTEAGPSLKRRHDQDDPDYQGYEGEMVKRPRVEGSSSAREDQSQEEVAGDTEKNVDNVQDCSIEDLVNVMIESVDLSSMSNVLNIFEKNIENNMQIVVYVDPDMAPRPIDLEESEAGNDMRSFFTNFIEINSDDDEDIRFEKICQVKEEDCDDIIIISDTEDDSVFMDAKDEEVADLLYRDLPSQDEIPETSPGTEATQVPETAPSTSTLVLSSAPTTTVPSSIFETGQSSRAQADAPPTEPVIPPSILEEGPTYTRQQRQRSMQQRYMPSRQRSVFLEDSQSNIFVSRRRPINIYAILGVEKESDDYQYEYLMFIKCQRQKNHLVSSPHLIVRVISITINKFVNIWYPDFEVERRYCKRYNFSEADFTDLSIDDIEFLYDHFRNLYHRSQHVSQALFVIKRFIRRQIRFYRVFDFQMAVESFQPVVNLQRPNRSLPNLDSYPLFTIVQEPYGVIYKNGSSQKCFLRFEEIGHYSDGTLKVIKLQLEQRLKEAERRFLETRSNVFQLENDEIRLLKKTLNTIHERLNFRSTLRRLEVLIGLNRLRQREEHQ